MIDHTPSLQDNRVGSTPQEAWADLNRVATAMRLVPPPDELCERLLLAVQKAALNNVRSMEALRSTVEEFTVTLKREGASPEAVLITLKAVINNRAFPFVDTRESYSTGDPLRHKISTWSIKEFFKEQSRL